MKQVFLLTALSATFSFTPTMAQTGICNTDKKGILNGDNGDVFQTELNAYTVNEETLAKGHFKDVSVKVVLGNWCEDSQREVPRLMKMLETSYMDRVPVSYYLVDREKFCADPEVQQLGVKYIPSLIFYRDGKEIGRIVETPEGSLEENITKITR